MEIPAGDYPARNPHPHKENPEYHFFSLVAMYPALVPTEVKSSISNRFWNDPSQFPDKFHNGHQSYGFAERFPGIFEFDPLLLPDENEGET